MEIRCCCLGTLCLAECDALHSVPGKIRCFTSGNGAVPVLAFETREYCEECLLFHLSATGVKHPSGLSQLSEHLPLFPSTSLCAADLRRAGSNRTLQYLDTNLSPRYSLYYPMFRMECPVSNQTQSLKSVTH